MSLYKKREKGGAVQKHKTASPEPSSVGGERDGVIKSVKSHLSCTASDRQTHIRQHDTEAALQTHTLLDETAGLQQDSHQPVDDVLQRVKDQHKTSMKNKNEGLSEGIKLHKHQTLLNRIYTQLYIIEGENGLNEEHEVLHMEKTSRTQHLHNTPINCNDIFDHLPEPGCKKQRKQKKEKIKTVLTKGIAGIGKTVSVQMFIVDWAEGKANQDVDFIFVLPSRELNLIKDDQYSLHKLVLDFHPELQDVDSKIYDECKVVFIFDGLDESRITLKFSDSEKVSDVTETSSVCVLMSNLIKGDLLPSALIWITSRPAAVNQIPSKYIKRVTEIQGFNDPQKEEYFRKSISDEHQASRIISHIKRARSLHIMCHIPVFCWISATVLQNILKQDHSEEIPKTLTEMYIHFLLIQINMRNQKNDEKDERDPKKLLQSNREVIVKLSELAYRQLMKGNVMFYEEDLRESGIDTSVYSGICTEFFKEESVIHQRKVYCFIHLSFQEFLAAFFVLYSHVMENMESLKLFLWYSSKKSSLFRLLKSAVIKSLQSENGHLDLFLRFLLGISLESNQGLLQDLLTHTKNSSKCIKSTTEHIKYKIKGGERLSAERCINLFLCLLEMNDQTLYREIQEYVKSDKHSENSLSPGHCSAIAYMLQISEKVLDEFDLRKYNTSDEGRRRLIPAVMNSRKALLAGFNLTDQFCESLASALQSSNSLRELNLSNMQDSGVKLLSDGLKSPKCHLNILRFTLCHLTDQCCESLASVLQSSNSLKELNLSNNNLQDSGVKLLSDALKSPNCQLKILKLSGCMVTEEGCCYVASALTSNPSHLIELDLSYNHLGELGVMLLSERLNDPNCTLDKLNVDHGGEIRITPAPQKYACDLTLDPNTAHTRLSLSKENRKVTCMEEQQSYPDHPERFEKCHQVMCGESLAGYCYWEAEWSGVTDISVTYKGINRKGRGSVFGYNELSWTLNCSDNRFTARHNSKETVIHAPLPLSNRVSVYLDWSAGTLSFYSVSDSHTLTHLHTFNTTFTEPLYAGFRVDYNFSFVFLR
ncbi:NACHT, LRR and PYD domains-containing protein 3-like isoform X2 [Myxocyprinus asiaticus]|nr:NACHT, LRR and PYD domains-containing protein 3-like isoform X2 [Myxocyprinus asiaticus]